MKTKILTALKTEYKTLGLSDKAFDGVASVLVKTVANEDEIDGVVKSDETKTLIKAFQADADKMRNEKAQLMSEFEKYKQEHPGTGSPVNDPPKPEDATEKLLKRIEALEQEKKERDDKSRRDALISDVRSKMKASGSDNDNILDLVLAKAEVNGGDKAEDIAEKLKADYDSTFTKFYGDGSGIPRYHDNRVPDYTGTEDDDFVERLRNAGKLPAKQS